MAAPTKMCRCVRACCAASVSSRHTPPRAGSFLARRLATFASVFAVAYSLRFSYDIFFGPLTPDLPRQPHEPPHWMRVPVELLVLACVVVGMFPAWSVGGFLATAARPVVGGTLPDYSLAVWHGFNTPLQMSLTALALGPWAGAAAVLVYLALIAIGLPVASGGAGGLGGLVAGPFAGTLAAGTVGPLATSRTIQRGPSTPMKR